MSSYEGLQNAAQKNPWIKFLVEYTTISVHDFARAKANQLISFPFFLNYTKYESEMRAQIPNCPTYYPFYTPYEESMRQVEYREGVYINKGKMTEKERFKGLYDD